MHTDNLFCSNVNGEPYIVAAEGGHYNIYQFSLDFQIFKDTWREIVTADFRCGVSDPGGRPAGSAHRLQCRSRRLRHRWITTAEAVPSHYKPDSKETGQSYCSPPSSSLQVKCE